MNGYTLRFERQHFVCKCLWHLKTAGERRQMCERMEQCCNLQAQLSPRISTGKPKPHGLYHCEQNSERNFERYLQTHIHTRNWTEERLPCVSIICKSSRQRQIKSKRTRRPVLPILMGRFNRRKCRRPREGRRTLFHNGQTLDSVTPTVIISNP